MDGVRKLRDDYIERKLAALNARLGQAGLSDGDIVNIEKEKAHLRRWKNEPLQPKADS